MYRDPVKEALRKCADDLETYIRNDWVSEKTGKCFPGEEQNFEDDMAVIREARAALAEPSAVEEMSAAMRECLAMFDSHMDSLYGRGHDIALAAGVELIRRKFVALIAKYAGAAPCGKP